MKNFLIILICISFFGCTSQTPQDLPITPVKSFDIPEPISWKLENGIKVFLMEDNELPFVEGTLYIRSGYLNDSSENLGILAAMGSQMRNGGAGDLTADQLDLELEKLSANIGSSFGAEDGSVSFSCLNTDLPKVFKFFTDVTRKPRFQEDRIALWKSLQLQKIKSRSEKSTTISRIGFNQHIFKGSVFSEVTTSSRIKGMSRADFVRAHNKFVRPNDAIITLIGSIKEHEARDLVDKYFSDWKPTNEKFTLPPEPKKSEGGLFFIKGPFSQSAAIIGQTGPKRDLDSFFKIKLFNSLFGFGGSSSKLVMRIREDLGLAYVNYGGIATNTVFGKNYIVTQTKGESVGEAIYESLNVLEEFQTELVSNEALEDAKRYAQNSYVFLFDSPSKIINRKLSLILQDFPPDFDESYLSNLHSVSREDIMDVAKQSWDVNSLVIIVVGDDKAYESLKAWKQKLPPELSSQEIQVVEFDEKVLF